MDLQQFFNDNKELVIAVVGGIFAVIAAVIKSKMKLSRALLWFLASMICLGAGATLFFLESTQEGLHFNPPDEVSLEVLSNKPALLMLGACLLMATGAIWGIINFLRLFVGGSTPLPDSKPGKKR